MASWKHLLSLHGVQRFLCCTGRRILHIGESPNPKACLKKLIQEQQMKYFLVILTLGILTTTVVFMDGSPYIYSDGWGYYHATKSLVEDRNFVTLKKPEYSDYSMHRVIYSQGKFATIHSPGYPLIAFPALLVAKFFDQGSIYTDYFKAYNGHSLWDGVALLLLNVLLTIFSFLFIYKILAIFEISPLARLVASGIPFLVSFYYTYAIEQIGLSHPAEVFAISGILFCTVRTLYSGNKTAGNLQFCALWSFFFGLAVLVRPTNAIILLPWLAFYIYGLFQSCSKSEFFKSLSLIGIIGSALLAVYLYYNWSSYGDPLTNGYTALWGVNFSFKKSFLFRILFSGCRGWLIYSPAVIFSVLGLILSGRLMRQKNNFFFNLEKNFSLLSLLSICLNLLIYSYWYAWWAGNSVGQRYFILAIPFLAIGFAGWLKNFKSDRKWLKILLLSVLTLCVFYSVTLMFLIRVSSAPTMARYIEMEDVFPEVPPGEEFTPLDVFRYHYVLINISSSVSEYLEKVMSGFKGGRSIFTLFTNLSEPIVKIEPIADGTLCLHIHPRPNGHPANSELIMTIDSSKFSHTYRLSGINFTTYGIIEIKCDETGCSFTGSDSIAPKIKRLDSKDLTPQNFIRLRNGLSMSLQYTHDSIKFPDFRLYGISRK